MSEINIELYKRLKQNLDEEISAYQKQTGKFPNCMEYDPLVIKILLDDLFKLYNHQNQKTIVCLKDVLEHFTNRPTKFDVARLEYSISDKDKKFIDYINNKIKKLEEEK